MPPAGPKSFPLESLTMAISILYYRAKFGNNSGDASTDFAKHGTQVTALFTLTVLRAVGVMTKCTSQVRNPSSKDFSISQAVKAGSEPRCVQVQTPLPQVIMGRLSWLQERKSRDAAKHLPCNTSIVPFSGTPRLPHLICHLTPSMATTSTFPIFFCLSLTCSLQYFSN